MVEIVVSRLPQRIRAVIESIVSFVLFGVFIILVWHIFRIGLELHGRGDLSNTLRLPLFPFNYGIAIALVAACCVFLFEFVKSLRGIKGK